MSETVRHHFAQFGPVIDALVVHDPVTNRSKQFAFVTFQYAESANHALRSRGMVIDGRQIEVRTVRIEDNCVSLLRLRIPISKTITHR